MQQQLHLKVRANFEFFVLFDPKSVLCTVWLKNQSPSPTLARIQSIFTNLPKYTFSAKKWTLELGSTGEPWSLTRASGMNRYHFPRSPVFFRRLRLTNLLYVVTV